MKYQVFSCDALTGAIRDVLPFDGFQWHQHLSAGSDGTVSVLLDGTLTKLELRALTDFWGSLIVIARENKPLFMGFVNHRNYRLGSRHLELKLTDLWGLWERRGAWDHSHPNMEKWKTTVSGPLAQQAAQAVLRGRTGPSSPSMSLPLTVPGFSGPSVSRTYYGYHFEFVDSVLDKLVSEGLDTYFEPRFIANGDADWIMRSGPAWKSGVSNEFFVTMPDSPVSSFFEQGDGTRVTNNARHVGEGSEQDMLVRSNRDPGSPYPLLDRVSMSKTVSDTSQLTAMANNDLALYEHPTFQWDLDIRADVAPGIGDVDRLWFQDDPWIADGVHERRVVKLSGRYGSEFISVAYQPTGGA